MRNRNWGRVTPQSNTKNKMHETSTAVKDADLSSKGDGDCQVVESCEIKTQASLTFCQVCLENKLKASCFKDNVRLKYQNFNIKEGCTQTSKTILELAKIEADDISPDSLSPISPRVENLNCYTIKRQYSNYELNKMLDHCGSLCDGNLLDHNTSSRLMRSKTCIGLTTQRSSASCMWAAASSLSKPSGKFSCSQTAKHTSASQTSTYMLPTASSNIKDILPSIQEVSKLIPRTKRGRSLSPKRPKINDLHNDTLKKVPYIDTSQTNLSSVTTFVEDLLKVDDLSPDFKASSELLCMTAETEQNFWTVTNIITSSVTKLRDEDWTTSLKGLAEVVEISRMVDIDIILPHMSSINQRLIELLKSPRSYVSRTACQAAAHLFEYVKDTRRPEFDDIVDILLCKTADANKFIRQDANLALDCMVTHISTFHAVRTLTSKGPLHKNHLVRTATIRLLICAVVIAGPDFILNPTSNEFTRKRIFMHMGRFLEDKNLETRKYAQRLYKVLSREPRFEQFLKKYLNTDQIGRMKKAIKLMHKN